jgi:UDP-N-acetylmuramyl pentapeptide synthase
VCRPLFEAARAAGHADAHWFETKEEAAAYVAGIQAKGDFVLVKASRGEAFEDILPLLEGAK